MHFLIETEYWLKFESSVSTILCTSEVLPLEFRIIMTKPKTLLINLYQILRIAYNIFI